MTNSMDGLPEDAREVLVEVIGRYDADLLSALRRCAIPGRAQRVAVEEILGDEFTRHLQPDYEPTPAARQWTMHWASSWSSGRSTFEAGLVVGSEVPGVVALVLAVLIRRGRAWVRWVVVADCAPYVVMASSALRVGDPRGFTQMALPLVVLVLVNLKTAREYFRRD